MSVNSISANINSIPILNRMDFQVWKKNILIVLGCLDLNFIPRIGSRASLTYEISLSERLNYKKWDHTYCLSLVIIRSL